MLPSITSRIAHAPAPDSAYYRAHLTAIAPQPPGVTAKVDPHAEWIEVSYVGAADVIIYGYSQEPYLRIAAAGVEENTLSPAIYINQAMFADLPTGITADATVAPAWRLAAATHSARWHDHRIHWMGQSRPPAVAADPSHPHLVGTWVIHASADGSPFDLLGRLEWIGKPNVGLSSGVWLLLIAANVPIIIFIAWWQVRSRAGRRRWSSPQGEG